MNKNLDLRIRKTYTCLMNAFLELLKEKNVDEITVNELCDKALVGRGTFYKHFTDKYEFFSFVLGEMLDQYLEEAESKIDTADPCSYYVAFFDAFLQFIEKNREAFGPLNSSSMTSVLLFSTSDTISQKLEEHFKMDIKAGHMLSVHPFSAARILTGTMAQSAKYLISHPPETRNEMLQLSEDIKVLVEKLYS